MSRLELEVFHDLRAPYRILPHAHPHFELLYIAKGARAAHIGGRPYRAAAGQLLIFEPGVVHAETSASERLSLFVVRFGGQTDPRRFGLTNSAGVGPVVTVRCRDQLVDLLTRMLEERRERRLGRDAMLSAYWSELAVLLQRSTSEAKRLSQSRNAALARRLQRAAQTLTEQPASAPTLPELARAALMSTSHFCHEFKQAYGCAPRDYAIRARIARAQELLRQSALSARDVALELGYQDPFFFYRQFKQRTGMTPSQYRAQVLEGRLPASSTDWAPEP